MTSEGLLEGQKERKTLFLQRGKVTAYAAKGIGSWVGTEFTRDFLLDG
jgi:hypothetical protein